MGAFNNKKKQAFPWSNVAGTPGIPGIISYFFKN
jgi:hypothetical protein